MAGIMQMQALGLAISFALVLSGNDFGMCLSLHGSSDRVETRDPAGAAYIRAHYFVNPMQACAGLPARRLLGHSKILQGRRPRQRVSLKIRRS